jgi:RNA polymerase sigma-70 factor (ECF subfamily)
MATEYLSRLTEQELLQQLRTGSADAFEQIYLRYWNKLLAIAYGHIKNKPAAEEAVQDVFMSLWDRRTDLVIESLPAYLATAVKFAVFKQILRERRRQTLLSEHYNPATVYVEEVNIQAKFLSEYMQGIIEHLPEKCRLVFKYSREEGLAIPDIARKMNISGKTAEAHLTKALKILRLSLKKAGLFTMATEIFFLLH